MPSLPKHALINGRRLTLSRCISHVGDGEPIVICEVCQQTVPDAPETTALYATQNEWAQGAIDLSNWAEAEGIVTTASSTADKLRLFRSLFHGRDNVYAHGYQRKDGGIAYVPACSNEWKASVCPKTDPTKRKSPGICARCPNRDLKPLTDQVLIAHFRGADDRLRDVVGLYVTDENCETSVLVADFDGTGWQQNVAAYRDAGRQLDLDVAVERSRSGNGGHAWLFFEKPVTAKLARNLGCALITLACSLSKTMRLDAYDRLFPTQDTLVEGGFGNLISLPLQGRAQREGNSVFVDDSLNPYPDQWEFLSRIRKATEKQAGACVAICSKRAGGLLGPLAYTQADKERTGFSTPSADAISSSRQSGNAHSSMRRPKRPLTAQDFPALTVLAESDMVYIPLEGLSAAACNRIRRLAAFANPEFYRAQAMHQSVWGKSRIIDLSEERDGCIALPRGCKENLLALFEESGAAYTILDERFVERHIEAKFAGTLRPAQEDAAQTLLEYDTGILCAPTGFGKTVVAASLIAQLGLPTLILVPRTPLLEQWVERLGEFLVIQDTRPPQLTPKGNPSKKRRPLVGTIGAGKTTPGGLVDVATFQSLFEKSDIPGERRVKDLVQYYGLVICDECHHAAAPQLECVLKAVRAQRVYGLSATPKRADGLDPIVTMLCGPVRHSIDVKAQAAEQGFARHLVTRYVAMHFPDLTEDASFTQVLDAACDHTDRTRLIAQDVLDALHEGRTPLVVSKRKRHARELARLIEEGGAEVRLLVGEGTPRQRREAIAEALQASAEQSLSLVATESYLGEGFDMPHLDALFLSTPISWSGNVTQQSGRLHRTSEGKTDVRVYDYVDLNVPMLERMYKKRLKTYVRLGYEPIGGDWQRPGEAPGPSEEADSVSSGTSAFVTAELFLAKFARDIREARHTIVMAAPFVNATLVAQLETSLLDATRRGVTATCLIQKVSVAADTLNRLSNCGCHVEPGHSGPSGYAIFDQRTIWYGSLPLLAFPKPADCSLRLISPEAAHQVMEGLGVNGKKEA